MDDNPDVVFFGLTISRLLRSAKSRSYVKFFGVMKCSRSGVNM